MLKKQEIRDQSDEQLLNMIEDIDRELFLLRNQLHMNHKLEKPHLIKENKKNKARIKTILTERKNQSENA